jgi:lipoprotein-anchoring transpeptidase ErfK/SrfK
MMEHGIARRAFLLGCASVGASALAGCASTIKETTIASELEIDPAYLRMYAEMPDERFPIPAVDLTKIDPKYLRRNVPDPTGERPGSVVVDTSQRFLYLVGDNGRAMRYGVGIGRAGFEWSGNALIARKQEWPIWTPPGEMIARQPELEEWRNGMPPSLENPLGSRALYIHDEGVDTLYRLHGTVEAWSIGKAVSSGCVRLLNQDVIDLYSRVPAPTQIVVA